jgi:type II secretory pathway pseudopilin PulG
MESLVVGAIAVAAALVVLVVYLRRRRRRREREQQDARSQVERAQGAANLEKATQLHDVTEGQAQRTALGFSRERKPGKR